MAVDGSTGSGFRIRHRFAPAQGVDRRAYFSRQFLLALPESKSLRWVSDRELVGVQRNYMVRRWDVQTGKELETFRAPTGGEAANVKSIVWPPRGQQTAATIEPTGVIRFWDVNTGVDRGCIVLLRDDQYLALTAEGRVVASSPGAMAHFVYVVEDDEGQKTLTPRQFLAKFGAHLRS